MSPRLWIDVEDLFEYAGGNIRPSGIQRVAFEIYRALKEQDTDGVTKNIVLHTPINNSFRVISWSEIEALFSALTDHAIEIAPPGERIAKRGLSRRIARRLVQRMPASLRPQVITLLLTSVQAAQAWIGFVNVLSNEITAAFLRMAPLHWRGNAILQDFPAAGTEQLNIEFASTAKAGDVLLALGSPWSHADYVGLVHIHRQRYGLRFAMLAYDLIPLRRPEWCDAHLVRLFQEWLDPILPLCDVIFSISQATAADVRNYAVEKRIRLAAPVLSLPIGTGFHPIRSTCVTEIPVRSTVKRALPVTGSYALIVSTIEARKNHQLLFRVWRRLLEELSYEEVPTLVFAGRVGWLVDDLMKQISNTGNLNGKLVLVQNPTDEELVKLYKGCLFTLFPSFYEGWGLPVTESLAFGKPALISNRTSLPEAGGTLARLFDPDNLHDAYKLIFETIGNRLELAEWENQVIREFRPVPWSATAQAILDGLGTR